MNEHHSPSNSHTSGQESQARPDLSNANIREDLATTGRCAVVHLPTGRICLLPMRHHGPCQFHRPQDADDVITGK